MLLTKKVKVKWSPCGKNYYEELGYKFTKFYDEFEVKIEDLQKNSRVKVECLCDKCGRKLNWRYCDYTTSVKENGETYCRTCSYMNSYINKPTFISFAQWCIDSDRQDVLDRWDYELNDCEPKEVSYASHNKKYWFKCNNHPWHKSELKNIVALTTGGQTHIKCKQCNSIAQYIIDNFPNKDLYDVWDKEKNGDLDPWETSRNKKIKIWIKCQEKEKHKSYNMNCYNFTNGHRCPICSKEKSVSIIEEKTKTYLEELGYEVLTEHKCTIKPINPKTKMPMPYDNEIILPNGKHLVIEVHGQQHYNNNFYKSMCNLKEEEANNLLHQRQLYDRYKRIYAKHMGYGYLEIPFTAYKGKNKEQYKELINNKIKEMLKD